MTLEKADGTQPTSALLVGVKNIDQVKQVKRANLGNASIDSDGVLMPTYNAANRQGTAVRQWYG